jgi:hypothetical protein
MYECASNLLRKLWKEVTLSFHVDTTSHSHKSTSTDEVWGYQTAHFTGYEVMLVTLGESLALLFFLL